MPGSPDGNFENLHLAEIYMSFVLNGDEIHLVDEWQEAPAIRYHEAVEFNRSYIRNESDRDMAHMDDRERDSRKSYLSVPSTQREHNGGYRHPGALQNEDDITVS